MLFFRVNLYACSTRCMKTQKSAKKKFLTERTLKVVFSRIYLDVPEELEKQIEAKSSSSRVTQIMHFPALLLSLLLCFS